MRRKLSVVALLAVISLFSACAGITSPNQDGDEERCQVTQGSDTRCGSDTLGN
jgi:hypothetical protein